MTFDNNIFSSDIKIFKIKEKSYENYFMSLFLYLTKGIYFFSEVMTFTINSNLDTNSWFSLMNKTNSNDLNPIPIGQNKTNNELGIYNNFRYN